MIELRRPNVHPPTLRPGGAGGKRAAKIAQIKQGDPAAKPSFPSHWNKPDVRGALYAFHGRVCGYCCDALPRNDRGDVEHFRPKAEVKEAPAHGGYWWLAYDFANYLMSCSLCNRLDKRKNSRFPMRLTGRHRVHGEALSHEPRALIEPSLDPVSTWLRFDPGHELAPVGPAPGLGRAARAQVRASAAIFKWNADGRLVRTRLRIIAKTVARLRQRTPDIDARLRESAIRYRPHAWIVRQLLRAHAPSLMPSPTEELQWLLDELWVELQIEFRLLRTVSLQDDKDTIQRSIKELLWAFATLWKDPPAQTPDVAAFVTAKGFDASVQPLVARL